MSRDSQRRLGLQAAAQVKEFRVALPVLMVLTQPQDVRRMPGSISLPWIAVAKSSIQKPAFKNQEKGYEKNIMRVNG